MNMMHRYLLVPLVLVISACGGMERLTKPEGPYYSRSTYLERIDENLSLKVTCIIDSSAGTTRSETMESPRKNCLYKTVEESYFLDKVDGKVKGGSIPGENNLVNSDLSNFFSKCQDYSLDDKCKVMRNSVIEFLAKVSDENCSTFLQRTFFTKSTADTAHNFGRDLITGSTAAVAVPSPPSAVALSLSGLLLRSYESFNSVFFLNEAFQPLENAISLARDDSRRKLDECRSSPYSECSIHSAFSRVNSYNDSCSLRVGVNRLQSLVHEGKNRELVSSLTSDRDRLSKEIKTLQDKLDQQAKLDQLSGVLQNMAKMQGALEKIQQQLDSAKTDVEIK